MNLWQLQLYNNLMALASTEDRTFFYVDHQLGDKIYRVFAYHYATYTDWLKPDALECRGAMFEIENGTPVRLACLPMEKFFNVNENPFTQNLDMSQVECYAEKMDGSLISTFIHNGDLRLKSKTSLASEQAIAAMRYLADLKNEDLHDSLKMLASNGFTTNLEWTSPGNRIVVSYQEPKLTILNVRFTGNGEYMHRDAILNTHPELKKYWVEHIPAEIFPAQEEICRIRDMKGFEGFVLYFRNGLKAKLKTDWYVVLHRTKDTISSEKKLYEAIVDGKYDDLMSLWHEDEAMKSRILEMHRVVGNVMIGLTRVYDFYNNNKQLDRKFYAIKGQKDDPEVFHLLMQIYSGKEPDFKVHMLKNIARYLPEGKIGDVLAFSED